MTKYIWQWYWDYDYKGNKYKAIYHGPKLDWMKPCKKKKNGTKKNKKRMKDGLIYATS